MEAIMATDVPTIQNILELAIALILALIAYYNRERTTSAATTAAASLQTAATNAAMAAVTPGAPAALATAAAAAPAAAAPAVTNPYTTPVTGTEFGIHGGTPGPKIDANRSLPMSVAVYPPYVEDYGPLSVKIMIDADPRTGPDAANRYILNCGDESPLVEGYLVNGQAWIEHLYDWKFDGKHSAKTFYPTAAVISVTGKSIDTGANDRAESSITIHDKAHEESKGIPLRVVSGSEYPNPR
jgi:hypothetical protein